MAEAAVIDGKYMSVWQRDQIAIGIGSPTLGNVAGVAVNFFSESLVSWCSNPRLSGHRTSHHDSGWRRLFCCQQSEGLRVGDICHGTLRPVFRSEDTLMASVNVGR